MSSTNGRHFELKGFRIDTALTRDGAWFAFEPFFANGTIRIATAEEAAVRVCYSGHEAYQSVLSNLLDEERDKHNSPGAAQIAALQRAAAQRLVTGWRGITLDGVDVPYSPERCLELMRDQEFPQFDALVTTASRMLTNFRKRQEARLGN